MKMIHHPALSCLVATLLSISFTQSRADIPSESLRAQAVMENSVSEKQKQNARTDARVEGMLSLKDPRMDVKTRAVDYFFRLSLQQFKPSGRVRSDLGYNFNLDQNNTTWMPSLSAGILGNVYSNDTVKTQIGLAAKVSYSNQPTDIVFDSGYVQDDVRLSTLLLTANPSIGLSLQRWSWLTWNLGIEYGNLNYTQTSSNELAHFNQQSGYQGWNTGFNFQVSEHASITTNYAQRKLNGDTSIGLQSNNFEVGTQITW